MIVIASVQFGRAEKYMKKGFDENSGFLLFLLKRQFEVIADIRIERVKRNVVSI